MTFAVTISHFSPGPFEVAVYDMKSHADCFSWNSLPLFDSPISVGHFKDFAPPLVFPPATDLLGSDSTYPNPPPTHQYDIFSWVERPRFLFQQTNTCLCETFMFPKAQQEQKGLVD